MLATGIVLYLCRHGQTDWNAAGRLQGQSDVPLNDTGREQARRNGERMREVAAGRSEPLRFLASPMIRAFETMQIVRAGMDLPRDDFPTDERLREIHFGAWQGYDIPQLRASDPTEVKRRGSEKWRFVPPGEGAESYATLADRIAPVFHELQRDTLVVAHGGITRSFLNRFCGLPEERAAHIDIPQDRILRVEGARYEWI